MEEISSTWAKWQCRELSDYAAISALAAIADKDDENELICVLIDSLIKLILDV